MKIKPLLFAAMSLCVVGVLGTPASLQGARLLYLRAPSSPFTAAEAEAIVGFVKGGGSLLLVLDEERRQSLEKTGVNSFIGPFGTKLTPDTEYLHNTGAVAKAGEINKADREVPFSGGRAVEGGTPFAFQLDKEGKGSQKDLTPHWGKDSAIFMEELLLWLSR